MVVSDFSYNAMQDRDFTVKLNDIHIINGGQTCKTIEETIGTNNDFDFTKAFVLVRIYKLNPEHIKLINEITYATNSQTAINLRDLKSNDDIQKSLIQSVSELEKDAQGDSTYTYKPKRDEIIYKYCEENNIIFQKFNDFLLIEPKNIPQRKVFTPYFKLWQKQVEN